MGVLQFPTSIPATVGSLPSLKFMVTTDGLGLLTTPGYLNPSNIDSGSPMVATDIVMALYSFNQQAKTGTFGLFTVAISISGVITLSQWLNPGVILPVTPNDIAVFHDVNGTLYDPSGSPPAGGIQIVHDGPIVSGRVGSNTGGFIAVSEAPGTGLLVLTPSANLGPYTINLVTLPMGQNCTIGVPDPGAASARFLLDHATNTLTTGCSIVANKVNGTEAANAVTASGMAGAITTSSLSTAGSSSYAITWTNSFITTTSSILLTLSGGTNTTENITLKVAASSGTATLTIYNNTAATALNGTLLISYLVF